MFVRRRVPSPLSHRKVAAIKKDTQISEACANKVWQSIQTLLSPSRSSIFGKIVLISSIVKYFVGEGVAESGTMLIFTIAVKGFL